MHFEPGLSAPERSENQPAFWFIYREGSLLVQGDDSQSRLPLAGQPSELGLQAVRTQYLGTLDGRPCHSAEVPDGAQAPAGLGYVPLRKLWGSLPDELFWVAGRAFQVVDWDRSHQFCGRCGTPTRTQEGERAKLCPSCGTVSYPRICPAVIVAVIRGERILLARARRFPYELYSVIAGFVDAGETLEECVHREVREETGIGVRNLRYFGSQPWPFPNSLMVGFTAEHADGEIRIDGKELVDAGWYRAQALPRIPDKISIARRLIDWFVQENSG